MLLLVESSGESFSRLGGSTVLEQVWVLLRADLHAGTETDYFYTKLLLLLVLNAAEPKSHDLMKL